MGNRSFVSIHAICRAMVIAQQEIRAGLPDITLTSAALAHTGEKRAAITAAILEAEKTGAIVRTEKGYRLTDKGRRLAAE